MKKVLTIQNPHTNDTSAVLIGSSMDSMDIILSTPEMNRTVGWINCIHDEIIDSEFQVVTPIIKDVSQVESKYHDIWKNDHKSYDLNTYMIDILARVRDDVVDQFNDSESIESMIGEKEKTIKFTNIEQHITNGLMLPSVENVIETNKIDKLVFRFTATDWIGWESVGYCIYDIGTKEIKCYISLIDFLASLEPINYGYAGMVYALEVMTKRDILTRNAISGITQAVEKRLNEFSDKESYNDRINKALEL